MDTLRFGVIGAGFMAAMRYVPAIEAHEGAVLQSICRRDEAKVKAAQEVWGAPEAYTDWRELLDRSEIDAVVVATPHDLHTEPTIAALERGLHVFLEKPMANAAVDVDAMLDAADAADTAARTFAIAYNNRYAGLWRAAKQALDDGAVGRIRQVSLTFSLFRHFFWEEKAIPETLGKNLVERSGMPEGYFNRDLSNDWRSNPQRNGGGTINNAGSHDVDTALWLAGGDPVEVAAHTGGDNPDVEYFISILARLDNDVQVTITFADAIPATQVHQLTVIGDDGFLAETNKTIELHRGDTPEPIEAEVPDANPIHAFIDCINGGPNLAPARGAGGAVKLTEAAYRSARDRATVEIPARKSPTA